MVPDQRNDFIAEKNVVCGGFLYVRRKKKNKHGFERFSWIFCKVILFYILN